MIGSSIFLALVITIIIECIVAIVLKHYKRSDLVSIVCINVVTNPLLNYLLWLNSDYQWFQLTWPIVILIEIIVVLVESGLLMFSLKKSLHESLLLSFVMNGVSYLAGILLFGSAF